MHPLLWTTAAMLTLLFGTISTILGCLPKDRYTRSHAPGFLSRLTLTFGGMVFLLGGVFELVFEVAMHGQLR